MDCKHSPRQAARREQILDAAAKCFVEQGFHGAGMARIAELAHMSAGHIYHYFESKDAIIAAIVARECAMQAEGFANFEAIPSEELLQALVEKAGEGVEMNTDPFQSVLNLEIAAEAQRNPAIAEMLRAHDTKVRSIFAALLTTKLGLKDAEGRVELLFTIFGGLPIRILRNPGLDRDSLTAFLRKAIRSVLRD
ncbi:TetR/AcrR family transcriptional regulator [Hyphomonas johnsonii]